MTNGYIECSMSSEFLRLVIRNRHRTFTHTKKQICDSRDEIKLIYKDILDLLKKYEYIIK